MHSTWVKEFPGAVTVCDPQGMILEMNDGAIEAYSSDGGVGMIGRNLVDCHPEPARSRLRQILETHRPNVYSIEKNGVKKLIYQAPWYADGEFGGMVEMALEIPAQLPHFVRS